MTESGKMVFQIQKSEKIGKKLEIVGDNLEIIEEKLGIIDFGVIPGILLICSLGQGSNRRKPGVLATWVGLF